MVFGCFVLLFFPLLKSNRQLSTVYQLYKCSWLAAQGTLQHCHDPSHAAAPTAAAGQGSCSLIRGKSRDSQTLLGSWCAQSSFGAAGGASCLVVFKCEVCFCSRVLCMTKFRAKLKYRVLCAPKKPGLLQCWWCILCFCLSMHLDFWGVMEEVLSLGIVYDQGFFLFYLFSDKATHFRYSFWWEDLGTVRLWLNR